MKMVKKGGDGTGLPSLTVNWTKNSVHLPNSLLTEIFPPISSVSSLQSESPSQVPPNFLAVESST